MAFGGVEDRREALFAVVVAVTTLGAAAATVRYPQVESSGTLVVGVVVLFVLLAPYVPLIRVPLTHAVVGVFVASVGVHGLLTDGSGLFWILTLGGIGLLLEDGYRRRLGREPSVDGRRNRGD